MELPPSGFRIDSLLSLSPPGALLLRPDPPVLSAGEIGGGSASSSAGTARVSRLESAALPGRLQRLQPRTSASSFLIRDILAGDGRCSDPGRVHSDPGQLYPGTGQMGDQSGPEKEQQDKSQSSESRVQGGTSDLASNPLKKPRKARTAFSDRQLSKLERSFQNQKYLSVQDRMELAASLQLSDAQVKTWYQNRRTKWKRQSLVGLELLTEAGRMFLPSHFLYPQAPPTPDFYLYDPAAPLLSQVRTLSGLYPL